ncbi:MAG TPA: hypothetical protein PK095_24235 [Myxococcota bacterium]|nr:hypothetical protein [Myxococcota bacterium]
MHRFDPVAKLSPNELEGTLKEGRRASADQLAGHLWHGLSLVMPQPLFMLFGRFGKAFHLDDQGGRLRGWNVRMRQSEGWTPFTFRNKQVTYGFYDVELNPASHKLAATYPNAFLIDYGKAGNRAWDPLGRVRDWVVAVNDDLLLGRMYLALGGRSVATPSYFALARGEALAASEIATPPASR